MISPAKGTSPPPAAGGNNSQYETNNIRPSPGEQLPSYGTQPAQPYIGIHRRSPAVRFCRALCIALLLWLLFTALIRSFVSLVRWNHSGDHPGQWADSWKDSVPGGIDIQRCAKDWQSNVPFNYNTSDMQSTPFPYTSRSTFELPLSSENLFVLSRGPLSAGVADVVLSDEIDRDTMRVDVVLHYSQDYVRDLVKVCEVVRKEGENGVGIFSSLRRPWRDHSRWDIRTYVEITVTIPRVHGGLINGFETDLTNTVQRVDNFAEKINFKKLSLKGSNSAIIVKSIRAVDGNIKTSNGHIEGLFNATKSLVLHTSNAMIKADVGLLSDSKNSTKTELDMHTSNGLLESNISLLTASKRGGGFKVSSRTSNNKMQLLFPASPVDSLLELNGRTSNAALFVSLNPAYEGKFSLATSNSGPTLVQRKDIEDPSGKGRKRAVSHVFTTKKSIRGQVSWSESGKDRGDVILTTSNSRATVEL